MRFEQGLEPHDSAFKGDGFDAHDSKSGGIGVSLPTAVMRIFYMPTQPLRQVEPRWPALVAMLSVNALFFAIPPTLKVGPDWLFVALVLLLTTPAIFFHQQRYRSTVRILGYAVGGIMTLAMIGSLTLLVARL